MDEERQIEIEVPEDLDEVTRLDQYLTTELAPQFDYLTRSRIQRLIDAGKVRVNNKAGKAGGKIRGGEVVTIVIPADVRLEINAQDIPLDILFEDADIVVINKPAGMVTHPGAGVSEGTLVNAVMFHCRDSLSGISGVMRPGIVHRLDKDTSGVLVVAKNDRAHQSLAKQIKEKAARRKYRALLEGIPEPPEGTVDKPIGRHRVERKKMAIVADGRVARTHYRLLSHWHKFCMIEAILDTGRTHQIRVHMASLGCPVIGDIVYNKKTTGTSDARRRLGLVGHALHAAYLSFTHPTTGLLLEFEAPFPPDFAKLIERLDAGL